MVIPTSYDNWEKRTIVIATVVTTIEIGITGGGGGGGGGGELLIRSLDN